MPLEFIPATADHIPELSRICHEAFSSLHDRFGIPRDIPDLETGTMIISQVVLRPDYEGVVAVLDGKIVGSNFLLFADEVAGVGPITVDPAVQSTGIGRELMRRVIEAAVRRGIRQTRLFQEAINTTSLSLYTSLGFDWRDSAALMAPVAADSDHPEIRPLRGEDLPAVEALSIASYGFSRAHDAARLLEFGLPAFLLVRGGKPAGYLFSTLFGHAAAESDADLLALTAHAARHVPAQIAVFICPLSRAELCRGALAAGYRTLKVLSYMSLGEFVAPAGPHLPSIQC